MKKIKTIAALAAAQILLCMPLKAVAQSDCYVPIAIYFDDQAMDVPEAARNVLQNSLTRIATANDFEADLGLSQFVMTAKADILDKSVHPGPPMQITQNMGITFYIVDTHSQTKFASTYIEMDGVGQNATKCYIDAFKRINANNRQIQSLIQNGRKKIIAFYDANYQTILREAEKQASVQNYEEAITLAISIPPCSKGGAAGEAAARKYYAVYRDRMNLAILNRARALWAAGQTIGSAREVCELLSQIDPEASCYGEAQALMREVKGQVRADIDFEMREKYRDQVALRKMEIQAMKEVGVAYGRGQRAQTTNLMFIR